MATGDPGLLSDLEADLDAIAPAGTPGSRASWARERANAITVALASVEPHSVEAARLRLARAKAKAFADDLFCADVGPYFLPAAERGWRARRTANRREIVTSRTNLGHALRCESRALGRTPLTPDRPRERRERRHVARATSSSDSGDDDPPAPPWPPHGQAVCPCCGNETTVRPRCPLCHGRGYVERERRNRWKRGER